MSADPIIYCLEQLTDYRQFERLCSDVMAELDYPNIEPLGGTGDRGRDALHISRDNGDDVTIFAYTVRPDWKKKLLNEDCQRIKEEGHQFNRLVFVCTSEISSSQKDKIRATVREKFGWQLELYDLERLRVCLASTLRHLVAQHPSIFCSPWFVRRGGLSIVASRDTLVIDHILADRALATWLARRLQLAGYRTWCYGIAPLAGEDADDSVRVLIEKRAVQYLPILSPSAIDSPDLVGRCGLACNTRDFTIPCWSSKIDVGALSTTMRALTPIRFDQGWSESLSILLDTLGSRGIVADLAREQGRRIALRSYVPEPVTQHRPERVFANVFHASVPASVLVFELEHEMAEDAITDLRKVWAFAQVSPRVLLAFDYPTKSVPLVSHRRVPEYAWAHYAEIEGRNSSDAVKELIRRSLAVACYRAGLVWCDDRKVFYFPDCGKVQRNVSYRHVDGRNAWVGVTGDKSYGTGDKATRFRYQLGPVFRVGHDEDGVWWVTTRIYVRITNCEGAPYVTKGIGKRRKTVTRTWWNKEWFSRVLAVMQALSRGSDQIEVGSGQRRLTVSTVPLQWECPISIDLEALARVGDFQEEMAAMRLFGEDEDEENELVDYEEPDSDE